VAGADNIIVTMTHASKTGQSKLLSDCTLPLTGKGCIKRVLTDLALLDIAEGKFILRERAPGVTVEDIVNLTDGELLVPDNVPEMVF
jgi:3-oxoacid CoA-transferase subunit B